MLMYVIYIYITGVYHNCLEICSIENGIVLLQI